MAPADGEIFESNHLAEIADIQRKLIQNLVKVGKTYCHLHTQLLNPIPRGTGELSGQLWERLWQPSAPHPLPRWNYLAKDARHHIQLGYHVINYPRYIPTTVELCRSSLSDIIDKLKVDLAYFKDDFQNKEMFEVIHKPMGNKPHPRTGHRASTPKPLDIPLRQPWNHHTPRGNPPWVTPVPPWEPLQPHLLDKHLFHHYC